MTATDLYYDPYDYAIDADPYPIWRRLRDEAPVYRNEQHGFYALSRYDDVLAGLLDQETYRSGHGIVLEMITDEPYQDIPMMIMKDPPEHTRLRKLVSRAFTPAASHSWSGTSPRSPTSSSTPSTARASSTTSRRSPACSRPP